MLAKPAEEPVPFASVAAVKYLPVMATLALLAVPVAFKVSEPTPVVTVTWSALKLVLPS